jgi:long-chain fatty acid transport protein
MILILVYALLGLVLFSSRGYCGGLGLYEVGPSQVGLASAGYAARADDASTLFSNPAGMTRLEKSEFLGGIQPLYTDFSFSPDSRTTATGNRGDARGWLPTGNLYYVHNISPDFKAGVGVLSYFGLTLDFNDNWVGRYYVQRDQLQGITIQPTAAYKLTDQLSIGAGFNIMYGSMEGKVAINSILDSRPDGRLKVEDDTWGYGANLGILFELNKGTRFGLNYLSEVKLDFSATPEFSGLGPLLSAILAARGLTTADLDLSVKVPQMVMAGFYHELNDRWAIMGDVGWQDWSRFGKVGVELDADTSRSLTVDLNYKDTWHFGLGAQYRLSRPWLLLFGASYDTSAVDAADRTLGLPMGESYRFGVGNQYRFTEQLSLGLGYELVWYGDLKVDQERGPLSGRVAGQYDDTLIHAIQLAVRFQF